MPDYIDIVLEGYPSSGVYQFVKVVYQDNTHPCGAEWKECGNGQWRLRVPLPNQKFGGYDVNGNNETQTLKLFKVTCKGMQHPSTSSGAIFGVAYVVAQDAGTAYQMVADALECRDIGFPRDRELHSVELISEATDYPACGPILYLPETTTC